MGGLLINGDKWEDIAPRLVATDFYLSQHRLIFQALSVLAVKGDPFDIVTVSEQLEATGDLEDAGGLAYLANLVQDCIGTINEAWIEIVRDKSIRRQLLKAGVRIAEKANV